MSKEDLEELSQTAQPDVDTTNQDEADNEQTDISLEEVSLKEVIISSSRSSNFVLLKN